MKLGEKETNKINDLVREGNVIAESPSFKTDIRSWKKKVKQFIDDNAGNEEKEKTAKILEKDAFYIYLFETEMKDLEKQAISHYKWQLEKLMDILKSLR